MTRSKAKQEKEKLQALADSSGGKSRKVLFTDLYDSSSSSVTDGSSTVTEEDVINTSKRKQKTKRKQKKKANECALQGANTDEQKQSSAEKDEDSLDRV